MMQTLRNFLRHWSLRVRTLGVSAARAPEALNLADLLRRKPVNLDTPELQRFIAGKVILVTGAGGSIGSEICRQTMKFCPQKLVLLDQAENALFEIDRELRHTWLGADIRPCIASITDRPRIEEIFAAEKPHVIFHCAAHKHVPMMELNPCEAIKNNIFGTKVVADAALDAAVAAFVMVSTDKAVNPTSVMGACKRVAELYIQSLNQQEGAGFRVQENRDEGGRLKDERGMAGSAFIPHPSSFSSPEPRTLNPEPSPNPEPSSRTRFVAVRFGNVLGSSGSVVPIFQKQINAGGPVTVTHPEMKRYFMTIPEASQLVMQAGAIGQGGEIFVLDMGRPVKIVDLAREMILRNGLVPDKDIEVKFTGIRPGEKLYEELACSDEQTRPTSHPKIRVWQLPRADASEVARGLALLLRATRGGRAEAITALAQCVAEYTPDGFEVRSGGMPSLRLVPAEKAA